MKLKDVNDALLKIEKDETHEKRAGIRLRLWQSRNVKAYRVNRD
jgi:hypothetical protein